MSYLVAATDSLAASAGDVAGVGDSLTTAHAAAVGPTTAVLAAAEDEISAAVAALFSGRNGGNAFAVVYPANAFAGSPGSAGAGGVSPETNGAPGSTGPL